MCLVFAEELCGHSLQAVCHSLHWSVWTPNILSPAKCNERICYVAAFGTWVFLYRGSHLGSSCISLPCTEDCSTASWNCWKFSLWLVQGFASVYRGIREGIFQNCWYNLTRTQVNAAFYTEIDGLSSNTGTDAKIIPRVTSIIYF